jgi:hypothetical protein
LNISAKKSQNTFKILPNICSPVTFEFEEDEPLELDEPPPPHWGQLTHPA